MWCLVISLLWLRTKYMGVNQGQWKHIPYSQQNLKAKSQNTFNLSHKRQLIYIHKSEAMRCIFVLLNGWHADESRSIVADVITWDFLSVPTACVFSLLIMCTLLRDHGWSELENW